MNDMQKDVAALTAKCDEFDAAMERFVDRTSDADLTKVLIEFNAWANSPVPDNAMLGLFASGALTRAYRDKLVREMEG